jgi:hypothetical protein
MAKGQVVIWPPLQFFFSIFWVAEQFLNGQGQGGRLATPIIFWPFFWVAEQSPNGQGQGGHLATPFNYI